MVARTCGISFPGWQRSVQNRTPISLRCFARLPLVRARGRWKRREGRVEGEVGRARSRGATSQPANPPPISSRLCRNTNRGIRRLARSGSPRRTLRSATALRRLAVTRECHEVNDVPANAAALVENQAFAAAKAKGEGLQLVDYSGSSLAGDRFVGTAASIGRNAADASFQWLVTNDIQFRLNAASIATDRNRCVPAAR